MALRTIRMRQSMDRIADAAEFIERLHSSPGFRIFTKALRCFIVLPAPLLMLGRGLLIAMPNPMTIPARYNTKLGQFVPVSKDRGFPSSPQVGLIFRYAGNYRVSASLNNRLNIIILHQPVCVVRCRRRRPFKMRIGYPVTLGMASGRAQDQFGKAMLFCGLNHRKSYGT